MSFPPSSSTTGLKWGVAPVMTERLTPGLLVKKILLTYGYAASTWPAATMLVQIWTSSGSWPFASSAARQMRWKCTVIQLVCSEHLVITPLPLNIPLSTWFSRLWKG